MKPYATYPMKNGYLLLTVNGYHGEEDFHLMQKIIEEVLQPEDIGYSVDSLCTGGYFVKDGISIRTSSESPYDCLTFYYQFESLTPDQQNMTKQWITTIIDKLHCQKPLD